jgi:5-methylcytosine-specific restriction endonuclease McrA
MVRSDIVALRRAELCWDQNGRCFYCTGDMTYASPPARRRAPNTMATLEHLIPRSEGGRSSFPNVVAACARCNNRRGTMSWLLFFCLSELERDERAEQLISNSSDRPLLGQPVKVF